MLRISGSWDSIVGIVAIPQAGRPRVQKPTREDVSLVLNIQTGCEAYRAQYLGVRVAFGVRRPDYEVDTSIQYGD